MENQKKPYYANSYILSSFMQTLQQIPKRYNHKNYLGGCMQIQEYQVASFLEDFVNSIAVILPEHYELMGNLLFVMRSSGHRPIKKLLPRAIKKYDIMMCIMRERQNIADSIKSEFESNIGSARFNILKNKKKMLQMSCSTLCALGDAISAEQNFDTTKINNKFLAFVSYRIELVLSGKMPIDADFTILLNKYGTIPQVNLYKKILSNQVSTYTPVQIQPVNNTLPKTQPKTKIKSTVKTKIRSLIRSVQKKKVKQPVQPKEKKSGVGFFKKLSAGAKKIFNKVKKPLLIGGIFALSIFGGKRAYDAAVESNNEPERTEIHTSNTAPVKKVPVLNVSDSTNVNKSQSVRHNNVKTTTPTNNVIKKTVSQLQYLKSNNPIDRNMDITQTANRLYQRFGNDAYKVVLVSAMTPYALNDYTKFDFRPSTHNMIEYLSTHELTPAQKKALDKFIATYVKNNSINMNNFATYNANMLRQNQR